MYILKKIIYEGKFDLSVVGHLKKYPVERWKNASTKKLCFFLGFDIIWPLFNYSR